MRIATSLILPDDLERARGAGELLVFAGAGVSTGAPANLPDFVGLAREIAEPSLPYRPEDEFALDRYLGRAERAGIRVQERAREKVLGRGGSHTPLHEHLLGIFGTASNVRLITTNFDLHFNTAAQAVFGGAQIPRYVGPALPPGRDFRGIAQLHGSLDQRQDRLVLTKQDFAEAYMTEGWAARFLVRVFAERAVLFVGYGLGDPVMQYLLSALPPPGRWYAFCHTGEQARWAEHDVIPIAFDSSTDGDRFGDLNAGLERWHWYAHASAVDHDRELRRLIALGPPSSPQDGDYLRARLETQPGRVTFWTVAKDPKWLTWAAAEKLLDPLFDDRSSAPDISLWARWCVSHFSSGNNPLVLKLCRERSVQLHSHFAFELALHLSRMDQLPPRPALRQLVVLLVNQSLRLAPGANPYVWLLEKLVVADLAQEALAILRWMTQVRLEPLDRLWFEAHLDGKEQTELPALANRVAIHAAPSDVDHSLEECGPTLAAQVGDAMVALGECRLAEAYHLLGLAKGTDGSFDSLSLGRTSIAPSNQDSFPHAEDALLALIRIPLDYWRNNSPDRLQLFAKRYIADERRLFKRLALYALAECGSASADDLLAKAVSERWAADFWVRPEFYRLLKAHYDSATERGKELLIASLRDNASWGSFDEHDAHSRFSLSQLLLRLSPGSAVTQAFAKDEQLAHPDWKEQDPDGLLTRVEVGWGGGGPSPIEVDQMLAWTPTEALARVVAELERSPQTGGAPSLLGAVQEAAKKAPAWGATMLGAVAQREAPASMTEALLWGLREARNTVEDQLTILRCIAAWEWPDKVTHSLGLLLDHWARDLKQADSVELLDTLDNAADQVFARARTASSGLLDEHGWTERAINHPAGHAASVWWRVANARDQVGDQFVLSVDDAERARWELVLRDETESGAHARVILGMASDRLSAGDYPWTERLLFPAFHPGAGGEHAAQLWDGRLMQTHWSWTTVRGLRPSLTRFFENSAVLVPARSRQLGGWVALLVTHPAKSLFTLADLQAFVHHAKPEARREFAEALPDQLNELEPDIRRRLWEDLLRTYWRDRRTNVPVALDSEELARMTRWVISLPEVAAEALAELLQTPGEPVPHGERVIWEWKQNDEWLRAHPREATAIIKWLGARRSLEPWTADDAVRHLEEALEAGAPRSEVIAAAEVLAGLPCQAAIAFVERLRTEDPPAASG